ncbi:hypothetical protein [Mangrovihabitans endophyticus]|uniref:Membrane protein n=1 Tax=Mangrovihabitans endophyticus TaxID=1751298 RepID=A0A8J3BX03_9ACTN|nr:hypothetical protein [Mangrovihabitans endophyticus]GGK77769.1 membrane protein [Mangrovihabitans endophyticus]
MAGPVSTTPQKTPWARVAATVALLTVIISVLLTAFAWPAARSSLHDVPVVVAGPPGAADQMVAALQQRMPDAFDITRVADAAAAEEAVRDREAYGAIDLSAGPPRVIVASAASPVVAQALTAVAEAVRGDGGTPAAAVRDLAPLPADDPRGVGLAASALPLVIGGMLAAVLLTSRVRGTVRRLAGALAYSVTAGLAMAAILQFWLGSLNGAYVANAGVIALSVAATSTTILGLEALFGTVGFGIGAAIMVLLGNTLSGATSAPEMLPGWSGQFGQFLPPGAAGWLLRSTAFFDGHGAIRPILVLTAWLLAGAILVVVGTRRAARRAVAARPADEARTPVAAGA